MTRPTVLLLLLALAVTACGGDDEPEAAATLVAVPSDPAPTPTATATASPTASPTPAATPIDGLVTTDDGTEPAGESTGPQDLAAADDARELAALTWLQAVHDGDTTTAWALTGPVTQDQHEEAPKGPLFGELEEGVGAFHAAEGRQVEVLGISEDMAVVTVWGQVTREGMTELDAAALPVVRVQDEWKVEWRAATAPIDWEVGGDLGQIVTAVGPPVAGIHLWVGPDEVDPDVELDDSQGDPRARVSTSMADPGVQVVTVAFVGDLPGVLQADATIYP